MLINASNLADLAKGFKTVFNKALAQAQVLWLEIAMEVASTGASETYPLMGAWPALREWVGERQHKNLSTYKWTIPNKTYEATVDVPRETVEDDQYGVYNPSMAMLAENASKLPDKLCFELLNNGFTGLAYDGQYFFDTDHKDGDGPTQSNKGVAALDATSFAAAEAAMMKLKAENGEPLDVRPTHIVVGPALKATAEALFETGTLANGGANPNYKKVKVVVSPRITSDTAWFLLDCSRPFRALVVQKRRAPVFVSQTDAKDDAVFERNMFTYGTDCRYGAGYGLWQLAYGSTGAGA